MDTNDPSKSCTDVASLNLKTSDSRDETDCTGKKEIVIFHGTSGITVLDPESKTYWKGSRTHTYLCVILKKTGISGTSGSMDNYSS